MNTYVPQRQKDENVCVWFGAGQRRTGKEESRDEKLKYDRVREWTLERRTCFAAIASLHLGQNTIIVSVRGASGTSHSATALSGLRRKRASSFRNRLVRVGRSFFRSPLWRCLSVHPPCFYFAFKLHTISNVAGPLLRRRSPTSAPLR